MERCQYCFFVKRYISFACTTFCVFFVENSCGLGEGTSIFWWPVVRWKFYGESGSLFLLYPAGIFYKSFIWIFSFGFAIMKNRNDRKILHPKDFGGKERVKENRQVCLLPSIKQRLSAFLTFASFSKRLFWQAELWQACKNFIYIIPISSGKGIRLCPARKAERKSVLWTIVSGSPNHSPIP